MTKKRILILSAPVGAGHIKAAEALYQAAKKKRELKVFHVDFLKYLSPAVARLVGKGWCLMVKYTPSVCKLIYENTNKPNEPFKKIGNVLKIDIRKYRELIKKYRPDIILSTHPLPAAVVSWMYDRLPIPNGVVITDYISHSSWVYPNNNRIFVACNRMISELKKFDFDEKKVLVSGIPVRDNFLKKIDVARVKKSLGLKVGVPVLLVMGGGEAVGPFFEILRLLSKVKSDFQVLMIAGKNRMIRKFLSRRFSSLGLKGRVLGFVRNIEDCMMVADLLISKAGGLTTTEAITIGLPFLIVKPTPGQEEGNTRFLIEAGAGIYVKNVREIGRVVEILLKNPEEIKKMSRSAKRISKPEASETILKEMLKLL